MTGSQGIQGKKGDKGTTGEPGLTLAQFKKWRTSVIVGFVIGLAGIGAGFKVNHDENVASQHKQDATALATARSECEHSNTTVHSSNGAKWAFWIHLEDTADGTQQIVDAVPHDKADAAREELIAKDRKLAASLTWIKQVNCDEKLAHPTTYVPPVPQHFNPRSNERVEPPNDGS